MVITIPLHQYGASVSSHSATDEPCHLGTTVKPSSTSSPGQDCGVCKIRMNSQGSMKCHYTGGTSPEKIRGSLQKAEGCSQAAVSEGRVAEWTSTRGGC